ncbi:MAG: tryptophan-rich sensory protein [Hyphomicrobiales bacterium]|nr:tryptophan-rich sensory protein [Hyphomicrobiales bacterium]
MPNRFVLAAFLILPVVTGSVIGMVTAPGSWYVGLAKPPFNPPGYVFGPVWTLLYLMIGYAGWRVWREAPRSGAMALWALQMLLNFAWSPVFFSLHAIGLALAIILLLLATILGFIASVWRGDRGAAVLFIPYATWVAFASVLNLAIWRLN